MIRLKQRGHTVNLQLLDNKSSNKYRRVITEECKSDYQLVPPDVHRRNTSERAIRTFKAHLLALLSGINPAFPDYLWDKLLHQTELTLNLLHQATLAPHLCLGLI